MPTVTLSPKLKADKPVLWTVAGEKRLAGVDFDPVALFMRFVDPAYHGKVHIMVVNTANAYSLTDAEVGEHWFVIAWLVEPKDDANPGEP